MQSVPEKLEALREKMKEAGVQACIIPTSDFHDTEYVCEYFGCRKYMSGFTGSAGTLVVLADRAALWTDGRYFIQAEGQLKGSGIELMRMSQKGVPDIEEWILDHLQEGDTVALDGRCVSLQQLRDWEVCWKQKDIHVNPHLDLVGEIWIDRPPLPATRTFHYDEKYCGKDISTKLAEVRQAMKKAGADHHIITKIDEVAWLYNLRADDIPSFPVALAYTIVDPDGAILYIDDSRLDETSRKLLEENNVAIRGYNAIYDDVKTLDGRVLLQPDFVNSVLAGAIPESRRIEQKDPVILLKAVKNETELANTREAHLKDGAAVVKFLYWLKKNVKNGGITEISAQEYLTKKRSEQDLYVDDSFDTISAYKEHAAMMHYSSTPETDVELQEEGMLLVDSGGHYLDGTTDITRTIVLGPISGEERFWFTKALQSHIDLQMAKFLYGSTGLTLDILAREPLWKLGMDYQCGTGHGVGHLLSVHEAPNGFRWRVVPERSDSAVLEEGMIQSDEPGVYEEGKFGIRHENEVVIRKAEENRYGQFMELENLTFVPFDREGIDPSLMRPDELEWLNAYHRQVYEKIAPRLEKEEAAWLKEVTAEIA